LAKRQRGVMPNDVPDEQINRGRHGREPLLVGVKKKVTNPKTSKVHEKKRRDQIITENRKLDLTTEGPCAKEHIYRIRKINTRVYEDKKKQRK